MWGRIFDWSKGLELIQPLAQAADTSLNYLNVPLAGQKVIKGIYSGITKVGIPLFRTPYELKTDPTQTYQVWEGHYDANNAGLANIAQTAFSFISFGLEIASIINQPENALTEIQKADLSKFLMALSIFANAASLCCLKLKESLKENQQAQHHPARYNA